MIDPEAFRLISWNTLHDYTSRAGVDNFQSNRLPGIISVLNELTEDAPNGRVIAFLCELNSRSTAEAVATETNLIDTTTVEYVPGATTVKTILVSDAMDIVNSPFPGEEVTSTKSLLRLRSGLITQGMHAPHRMNPVDAMKRFNLAKKALYRAKDTPASIVAGDFNSFSVWPSRQLISRAGYEEVHKNNKPIFPSKLHWGRNHRLMPDVSIDAIYYKGLSVIDSGSMQTAYSDHPVLWADFKL